MDQEEIAQYLEGMPDEVLSRLKFSMPWQYEADDNSTASSEDKDFAQISDKTSAYTIRTLQNECWKKFHENPQLNTSTRGLVGRLTGLGFSTTSEIQEIQDAIDEIELDQRNRLYTYWPKYVARSYIEGELFLSLTVHDDSFVEVDFIDPIDIGNGGDDDTGILFHPRKKYMPLFYNVMGETKQNEYQIPSIFIARYPELINIAAKNKDYKPSLQAFSKAGSKKFNKFGGFNQFIVSWDQSFITRRAISYLRTTLQWINHYENLKKYEIDHKKSAGSYLWIFKITDPKAFKLWLSLSDEDKRKTGIGAKKTPGGSLVLPPGMEVEVKNPTLTSIKEQDTDILQMVSSGLNEPEDMMTGASKGTFASVKASRGPYSDRVSDEISSFSKFLRYDFWGNVFFLKSKIGTFPEQFAVNEAVTFKKQEPVFKKVKKNPERLIDISFPTSSVIDYEAMAKAFLGVKHGPINDTVGIPNSEIARRLGFSGYGRWRLQKATEDEKYPELIYSLDAESLQEQVEAEPGTKKPMGNPAAKPQKVTPTKKPVENKEE